ncbi:DNA cytosine methyltransferase [Paraburkholderia kururiensis]|uniref:DNA cytosine methyltransferase n=1 Tax=Paraburkholderia kururiensis TaxID=984307 RepID=UPI0009DE7D3D|nr:DNA (cytosine-5-)-methyltransferase [Paraburkholderia kururiensis]
MTTPLIYGSVCSGIEAASVAWHPLGWRAAFLSEIDAFPSAVLAHHYPNVPNLGDMTKYKDWPDATLDLLVGGTPCQSFSVAGLRKGLDDPRGNLMLTYLAIAKRFAPRWVVWENVPGVLSSNKGRDFGTFLAGLGQLGYGFAYRVLDAQFFGIPQRRRRVFVVGYLGDWRPAAAVLFERESLLGHPAPRREAWKDVAGTIAASTGGSDENDAADGRLIPSVARALTTSNQRIDAETETLLVAHSLRGEGFDASEDGTGRGTPLVPVAFDCKASGRNGFGVGDIASTMRSMGHNASHQNGGGHLAVAFQCQGSNVGEMGTLRKGNGNVTGGVPFTTASAAVRRLTPRECERLQGFPDDYTLIEYGRNTIKTAEMEEYIAYLRECFPMITREESKRLAADGPRYKALGNSMAVPVMHWLGCRIQMFENLGLTYSAQSESFTALDSSGVSRLPC